LTAFKETVNAIDACAGGPPTDENAEVEAVLDAWARGPPTPPASLELRRTIKRARSTSDAKDSPTP